jgi:hypothetical protein
MGPPRKNLVTDCVWKCILRTTLIEMDILHGAVLGRTIGIEMLAGCPSRLLDLNFSSSGESREKILVCSAKLYSL